jgi:hypothetical protein
VRAPACDTVSTGPGGRPAAQRALRVPPPRWPPARRWVSRLQRPALLLLLLQSAHSEVHPLVLLQAVRGRAAPRPAPRLCHLRSCRRSLVPSPAAALAGASLQPRALPQRLARRRRVDFAGGGCSNWGCEVRRGARRLEECAAAECDAGECPCHLTAPRVVSGARSDCAAPECAVLVQGVVASASAWCCRLRLISRAGQAAALWALAGCRAPLCTVHQGETRLQEVSRSTRALLLVCCGAAARGRPAPPLSAAAAVCRRLLGFSA